MRSFFFKRATLIRVFAFAGKTDDLLRALAFPDQAAFDSAWLWAVRSRLAMTARICHSLPFIGGATLLQVVQNLLPIGNVHPHTREPAEFVRNCGHPSPSSDPNGTDLVGCQF